VLVLTNGGFLYLDQDMAVIQVSAHSGVGARPAEGEICIGRYHFGVPHAVSKVLIDRIETASLWHPMHGGYLKEHGARAWAWLGPEEHPNGSHGGFAFQLEPACGGEGSMDPMSPRRGKAHETHVFFPIVEA
jgi:hypothetical protein